MHELSPVFTEKAECRDCYKCVRNCPVKAIRLENGRAAVLEELCIACGSCVNACPVGAKRIRDDLLQARELLKSGRPVIASLAPSFVSEFPDVSPSKMIHALKQLGFTAVSETALGAQQVSASIARQISQETEPRMFISSACPAVVELLTKYHPEHAGALTSLISPVLAHCRMLKNHFGEDAAVVFFSPCAAKKKEASTHPELLESALTFADLRQWLRQENIDPWTVNPDKADVFEPEAAREGALYPVDGGMIDSLKPHIGMEQVDYMDFSGIEAIQQALRDVDTASLERHLFLELLACRGGCVNGPGAEQERGGTVARRRMVYNYAPRHLEPTPGMDLDLRWEWVEEPVVKGNFSSMEIRQALKQVGKYRQEDELNCGGCGYDNCRAFAEALLEGKAERGMCVSYMRKLAQNKANALLKTMPSGVVLVDENLCVVESNEPFAKLLGQEAWEIYQARPGMEGARLERLASFHALFANVLETGVDLLDRDLKLDQKVVRISIFSIEKHRLVGSILQDITQPAVQRQEVIRRAREVIDKNLRTVQEIACLMGENAAETEVILDSVINSFTPEEKSAHEPSEIYRNRSLPGS